MEHEKIDHKMEFEDVPGTGNGASLSRQVTVTMSPDQYERLFFQPSKPAAGDFAKRFGYDIPCARWCQHETDNLQ